MKVIQVLPANNTIIGTESLKSCNCTLLFSLCNKSERTCTCTGLTTGQSLYQTGCSTVKSRHSSSYCGDTFCFTIQCLTIKNSKRPEGIISCFGFDFFPYLTPDMIGSIPFLYQRNKNFLLSWRSNKYQCLFHCVVLQHFLKLEVEALMVRVIYTKPPILNCTYIFLMGTSLLLAENNFV